MRLASLGSGSRGNATLVQTEGVCLLIDCGFSVRELEKRAADLEFDLRGIDAILVTHEHSDHCSGVAALARHCEVPVYLTHGTRASGRLDACRDVVCFNADAEFRLGDIEVLAVAVPHDAREPVQYRFTCGSRRLGVLTDLGSITPHVSRAFADCDALVLEFNHDRRMLAEGPYPPALKRRVGGDWGHLSNTQALELLQAIDRQRLRSLVVAHTSDKNNSRECIASALEGALPDVLPKIIWAAQDVCIPWLDVGAADGATVLPDTATGQLASERGIHAY